MPEIQDISQLIIGDDVYNIKDAQARGDIAVLQSGLTSTSNEVVALRASVGHPEVITNVADFTNADQSKLYAYMGTNSGNYQHAHWYYYNNGWQDGGEWGTAVGIDDTLTIEGHAADAKATGLAKSNLDLYNVIDVLKYCNKSNATSTGIQYEWTNNNCYIHGTASANTFYTLYVNYATLPEWLIPGHTYYLKYQSNNVRFQIWYYTNGQGAGTGTKFVDTKTNATITIPIETTGIMIRFYFEKNLVVDEIVAPQMFNGKTTNELENLITTIETNLTNSISSLNIYSVDSRYAFYEPKSAGGVQFTWNGTTCTAVGNSSSSTIFNRFIRSADNPGTLPPNITPGTAVYLEVNSSNPAILYMEFWSTDANGTNKRTDIHENQIFIIPQNCVNFTYRIRVKSSVSNINETIAPHMISGLSNKQLFEKFYYVSPNTKKHLRILQLGHSTTLDAWSYVPFILKNYGITIDLIHEYRSGQKMSQLVNEWETGQDPDIGSWIATINTGIGETAWTKTNRIAPKSLVELGNFDMIAIACAGQNVTHDPTHYHIEFENPNTGISYVDTLLSLINASIDKPTPIWLSYATTRYTEESGATSGEGNGVDATHIVSAKMCEACQNAYDRYPFQGVLNPGLGVFNARTNAVLDALGSASCHHLLWEDGVHNQQGITRYIMGLTIVQQLFNTFFPHLSVMYDPFTISSQNVTDWNLNEATANRGEIQGMTNENRLLAQKCAIMATKYPFTIKTIS